MPLPESRREIEELLAEAKYYLVQGLVDECQAALQVGTGLRGHQGQLGVGSSSIWAQQQDFLLVFVW